MGYLVDSNVFIDYVSERFTQDQLENLDLIFDKSLKISVITKIEILGFNSEPEENSKMLVFMNDAEIISLDDAIVDKNIALKKQGKIKTPDTIIAATALINDLVLITNNISDFKKISRLKILDPYRS